MTNVYAENNQQKLLDSMPRQESLSKEEFYRITTKYLELREVNKQYANMLEVIYDYKDMREFMGLCLELHGMKEEDVQIIIQEFIDDGLINPVSNLDMVPSLSMLGYSIYFLVVYKNVHLAMNLLTL